MFINVDLPDPDDPTIATNSPSSIRSDTSISASTASPVGRLYVFWIPLSSITSVLSSMRLPLADQHFVSLVKSSRNFEVIVVAKAWGYPSLFDLPLIAAQDKGLALLPAERTERKREHTRVPTEIDADRGGHLGTQDKSAGRAETDHHH